MSQTSSAPTTSTSLTPTASPSTSPTVSEIELANSPILRLLNLSPEGMNESELRASIQNLRQLRAAAPALKKALVEEDEEEKQKTETKKRKKKNEMDSVQNLLGKYGV